MKASAWTWGLPAARPSSARRAAGSAAPAPRRWPRPAARSWSTAAIRTAEATADELAQGDRREDHPGRGRCRLGGGAEGAVRGVPRAGHPDQQQCRAAVQGFPRARSAADDRRRHRQHDRGGRADAEGDRPDGRKKFGRIVYITSGSVKMPLVGLDLSSGARAGLTGFLAGIARSVAARTSPSISSCRARSIPTACARTSRSPPRSAASASSSPPNRAHRHRAGETHRPARRTRRHLRLPVLGACRLHHRAEHSDRRRGISGRVLRATSPS